MVIAIRKDTTTIDGKCFDVVSRGHRVYWPENQAVSVERNVYFAAAARLEGEEMDVPSRPIDNEPRAVQAPTALPPQPVPPSPAFSVSSSTSPLH